MGRIIETKVTRFDGGIVNDPGDMRENTCLMVSNFDILTDKFRMTPYRDSESGDDSASANKISNFCLAQYDSSTYALYGLGISATGTSRAKVFYKNLTTNDSNDLTDGGWQVTANPESSTNNSGSSTECFVYYKNQGLIYMVDTTNDKIMTYDPDGSGAWVESQALTCTHATQGIVHSKDDVLYIGYYNSAGSAGAKSYIASKNGSGSWNTSALTLPDHLIPMVLAEFGNYIAIGCNVYNPTANDAVGSVVYIWDRDSSLATLSDSVYWGDDRLLILDDINGTLVGVSVSVTARNTPRIVFRYLSVSSAIEFATLLPTAASGTPDVRPYRKQKHNDRLYFLMEATIDGVQRDGLWSVGGRPGEFTIIHERTPNNNTDLVNSEDILKGFYLIGDYAFISYTDNGTYVLKKTNNSSSYTASSIYEKQFSSIDSATTKKLLGVSVMFEPLPVDGQVVLKYKADAETSFTTVFTHTTNDSISHSAINVESTGANLPQYKEIVFRIESTGGAVITGLKFKEEIVDKDLY